MSTRLKLAVGPAIAFVIAIVLAQQAVLEVGEAKAFRPRGRALLKTSATRRTIALPPGVTIGSGSSRSICSLAPAKVPLRDFGPGVHRDALNVRYDPAFAGRSGSLFSSSYSGHLPPLTTASLHVFRARCLYGITHQGLRFARFDPSGSGFLLGAIRSEAIGGCPSHPEHLQSCTLMNSLSAGSSNGVIASTASCRVSSVSVAEAIYTRNLIPAHLTNNLTIYDVGGGKNPAISADLEGV